jgi:hypothetical protein
MSGYPSWDCPAVVCHLLLYPFICAPTTVFTGLSKFVHYNSLVILPICGSLCILKYFFQKWSVFQHPFSPNTHDSLYSTLLNDCKSAVCIGILAFRDTEIARNGGDLRCTLVPAGGRDHENESHSCSVMVLVLMKLGRGDVRVRLLLCMFDTGILPSLYPRV